MIPNAFHVKNRLICQRERNFGPQRPPKLLKQKGKLPPNIAAFTLSQSQHMQRLVYQFPNMEGAEMRKDHDLTGCYFLAALYSRPIMSYKYPQADSMPYRIFFSILDCILRLHKDHKN